MKIIIWKGEGLELCDTSKTKKIIKNFMLGAKNLNFLLDVIFEQSQNLKSLNRNKYFFESWTFV